MSRSASSSEISKAYRSAALYYHPDKSVDEEDRKRRERAFMVLNSIRDVLGDATTRFEYGTVTYLPHCTGMCVSSSVLNEFYTAFRGSDTEIDDICEKYDVFQGNMKHVYSNVLFDGTDHERGRICGLIEEQIKAGRLQQYPAFSEYQHTKAYMSREKAARRRNARKAARSTVQPYNTRSTTSSSSSDARHNDKLQRRVDAFREWAATVAPEFDLDSITTASATLPALE